MERRRLTPVHGNNWYLKEVKKKLNNVKGSAKARMDCSRREARGTAEGPNEAGGVENKDILILKLG